VSDAYVICLISEYYVHVFM